MRRTRKQRQAERRAAFEAVVSEYEAALLRYVVRILRDHDASQDIVQDSFIKLYRSWDDEMKPAANLSSWLYRVAHNSAVDYLRKRERRRSLHHRQAEERVDFTPPDRGEAFKLTVAAEQARAALQGLSVREQELVVLKVYEEKSYKEISEITGVSVSNVGYILHHAMKKMAEALKKAKSQ